MTQAYSGKEFRVLQLGQSRIRELPVTSLDVEPLTYKRFVMAKAITRFTRQISCILL